MQILKRSIRLVFDVYSRAGLLIYTYNEMSSICDRKRFDSLSSIRTKKAFKAMKKRIPKKSCSEVKYFIYEYTLHPELCYVIQKLT